MKQDQTKVPSLFSIWLKLLMIALPLPLIWALANPMFASPDEPAHMVRSQGIVQGDSKEPYVTDGIPSDAVGCIAFNSETTANCMDLSWGQEGLVQPSSTNAYPPLFHAVAGLPTLIFKGLGGAYIMRLWLAIVSASLFALAAALLWFRQRHCWTIGGLIAAMTPMVVFTTATVNPSGLTAATASLIWAAGINITRPTDGSLKRASRLIFTFAVVLFPFLRRDALAWELAILLILATTPNRQRVIELRKDPFIAGSLILAIANMIFVWFTWSGAATDSFVSNSAVHGGGSWGSGLGSLYSKLLELIGLFGWLDSPMTNETWTLGTVLLGAFMTIAITGGQKAQSRTVTVTFVSMLLAPVLIGAVRFGYFQGRYLFPIWVGCALLAGQALAESDLPMSFLRRMFMFFVGFMAIIQFFAFAQNLRRYAVGRTGTWNLIQNANWHPPMMSNLSALSGALVAIVISLLAIRSVAKISPLDT